MLPSGTHTATTHFTIFYLMLSTFKCIAIWMPDVFTALVKEVFK